MTLREIRSNCGNLQSQPLHANLPNTPGLFLDFSWVTGNPEVMWHVPRGDCVQVVYKKAGLKGLKMDLSNAESTTDS